MCREHSTTRNCVSGDFFNGYPEITRLLDVADGHNVPMVDSSDGSSGHPYGVLTQVCTLYIRSKQGYARRGMGRSPLYAGFRARLLVDIVSLGGRISKKNQHRSFTS